MPMWEGMPGKPRSANHERVGRIFTEEYMAFMFDVLREDGVEIPTHLNKNSRWEAFDRYHEATQAGGPLPDDIIEKFAERTDDGIRTIFQETVRPLYLRRIALLRPC